MGGLEVTTEVEEETDAPETVTTAANDATAKRTVVAAALGLALGLLAGGGS